MNNGNQRQKRDFLGLRPRSTGGVSGGGHDDFPQRRHSGSFIYRIRDSWSSTFSSERTSSKKRQIAGLSETHFANSVHTRPSSFETSLRSNTLIHSAGATTSVLGGPNELSTGHSTTDDVHSSGPSTAAEVVISITGADEQHPPLSTLWEKTLEIANRKLLEKNLPLLAPNVIDLDTAGANTAEILQSLNIALADVNKSRWRYKNWNGEEVVVVEMLGKVLGHIDRYAKIVDTAIQHNPDIIALVWGGIRTVMQVALNHKEAMECLEFAIATVVEKIAICEFYASAYVGLSNIPLQSMSASNRQKFQMIVDSALPRLYASVIVFTVKAREYLCPSTGIKSLTNLFKGFAVEIKAFLDDILEAEQGVQKCADIALMQNVKTSSEKLLQIEDFLGNLKSEIQPLIKLNDTLKTIEIIENQSNKAEEDRILKLLQLLSPLEPLKRHQDICAIRLQGTGAWLLENESFRKWQDINMTINKDRRTFCCYGMPGAGKTMISSMVIEHLNSQLHKNSTLALYSDYRDQSNQTSLNIVGSLLYQYLTSYGALALIPQEVVEMLEDIKKRNSKVTLSNISEMFKITLQFENKQIFVCIDALDELEPQARRELLLTLNNDFSSATGIRYFLTGRPHVQDEIHKYLGPIDTEYEIHMTANLKDIHSYVQHKIEEDEILNPDAMDEELKRDILHELVSRSQGMFLLPALHIARILDDFTISQRRKALESLPTTLYDTFTDVVRRIQTQRSKSQAKLGMKVLMWLHLAIRPLKLCELQHALSVETGQIEFDEKNIPPEKTIVNSCFGLVIVDKETETIRFVHFTLEEYFRAHGDEFFPNGHSSVAEDCLKYLNLKDIMPCESDEDLNSRAEKFSFFEYAALNWGNYVKRQCTDVVEFLALSLIRRDEWVSCAAQFLFRENENKILQRSRSTLASKLFSGLHMAAYFGLDEVINKLSDDMSKYWDGKDEYMMTPLAWATLAGHEPVVRLLLKREDVDPKKRYISDRTLLHCAAIPGHESVMRLLLEREVVDPNIQDNGDDSTALLLGAYRGHESIVRLLLKRKDVDPNLQDDGGKTALMWGIILDYEPIVRLLLERKDTNPNLTDKYNSTGLIVGALHGRESIVRLLLEQKDVDPNLQDNLYNTALKFGASCGHESIVRLLLGRADVDPNIKGGDGGTALLEAARKGHGQVVSLLLQREDVDPNIQNSYGRTALSAAVRNRHGQVVRLLLQREDVDPNIKDEKGNTAFILAAHSGEIECVRTLAECSRVNIHAKNNQGKTACEQALQGKYMDIVSYLRSLGVGKPS